MEPKKSVRNSTASWLIAASVWGWRGRIGKKERPDGGRVDEVGALPDLNIARNSRLAYVLLDANASTNPKVKKARTALVCQLRKQKADVKVLALPVVEGVNGPDDYVGIKGDTAMAEVFESGFADWRAQLITRADGSPNACLANAITVLRQAPEFAGVLGFNEFSLRVVTRDKAPFHDSAGKTWTDADDSCLCEWLQRNTGIMVNSNIVAEAVQVVSRENKFHPVKEYLQGLEWDGISRLQTWLVDYVGAQPSEFVHAVGRRWMISAVARIFRPGCQADYVLVLFGDQGLLKSSALRELVGDEWFTDSIPELGTKDSFLALHGKLVVELSELAAIRRGSETERVKQFLTCRRDHFRPPYGRRAEDIPRSCVFAGTTNKDCPFTDESGNRRYWPVDVGKIDIAAIRRDRDQLWAEAIHLFDAGHPWWLETRELNQLAAEEQAVRVEEGAWDSVILAWIDNPTRRKAIDEMMDGREISLPIAPWHGSDHVKVSVMDILIHGLGVALDRITQTNQNAVSRCLKNAGWRRKQVREGERRLWFYVRGTVTSCHQSVTSTVTTSNSLISKDVTSVTTMYPVEVCNGNTAQLVTDVRNLGSGVVTGDAGEKDRERITLVEVEL